MRQLKTVGRTTWRREFTKKSRIAGLRMTDLDDSDTAVFVASFINGRCPPLLNT
jgi:hypothetical protein